MDTNFALDAAQVESRGFITRVYAWMSFGLALTAWIAWSVASSPAMTQFLIMNRVMFYGLVIGEFALVIALSGWVRTMTPGAATLAFVVYAAFNGATLSVIFLAYAASSIASTFLVTSATFGAMSFYGFLTKRDLTSLGQICFMGLIGVVIATLVNMFVHNDAMGRVLSYLGVLVFTGLTAYDTQKIKSMTLYNDGSGDDRKQAIMGALTLYLDFVNLFLMILRLNGRRR